MKITKCDRCGKMVAGKEFGVTTRYIGSIRLYQYLGQEEMPSVEYLDLCRECQGKLDEFVNKFMEKK